MKRPYCDIIVKLVRLKTALDQFWLEADVQKGFVNFSHTFCF